MTNIGNERGEILNSVFTTSEGEGLHELCQGIVERYRSAGVAQPSVIYVDGDCCSQSGVPGLMNHFLPWTTPVRLDSYHWMRRITRALTTEHHPLYGPFCSQLSSCIFEWDAADYARLCEAKAGELRKKMRGKQPTDDQIKENISSSELTRHCRRRTREKEEIRALVTQLLKKMWKATDALKVYLINHGAMKKVWEVQQKHLDCLQDVPGVELYVEVGQVEKGGVRLPLYRCARGSSSLESFHRHQCAFVPGKCFINSNCNTFILQ